MRPVIAATTGATTTTGSASAVVGPISPPVSATLAFITALLVTAVLVWTTTPRHLRAKFPSLLLVAFRGFGYAVGYSCVVLLYAPIFVVHHIDRNWGVWPVWFWGPPTKTKAYMRMRKSRVDVEEVSDFELDLETDEKFTEDIARPCLVYAAN
ncbi:hypothetical protein F5Y17DRAFT_460809 [Xylariaceae sp. FL0594]|nr:hypothetical protein F5Y17DRAFT_460809 [Xylariaceae sp. FL0594]